MIAIIASVMVASPRAQGGDIDTEHIFAFMIGSDVGQVGEREFQSQSTGRFGKSGGRYRAGEQEFELELVPRKDVRIELGSSFAAHQVAAVPTLADHQGFAWQGASIDVRYRFLDRETTGFGVTLAASGDVSRLDERRAVTVRGYGAGLTLAIDREIVPGVAVVALNLGYQPDWTHELATRQTERESSLLASLGVMIQARPGILLGGEARYIRHYEGIGLDELAGQALFVGPTAYVQLSERARLTLAWSAQVWGRLSGSGGALDLVNEERHQTRLVYGVSF